MDTVLLCMCRAKAARHCKAGLCSMFSRNVGQQGWGKHRAGVHGAVLRIVIGKAAVSRPRSDGEDIKRGDLVLTVGLGRAGCSGRS